MVTKAVTTPKDTKMQVSAAKKPFLPQSMMNAPAPLVGRQSASWRLPSYFVPKLRGITQLSINTTAGLEQVLDRAIQKICSDPNRYVGCIPARAAHKTGTETFGARMSAALTAKVSPHRQKLEASNGTWKDETPGQLIKRLVCIALDTPEHPTIITAAELQAEKDAELEATKRKVQRFEKLAQGVKPSNDTRDFSDLWRQRLEKNRRKLEKLAAES